MSTSYKYNLNSSPVAIERSGMLSDYWSTGLVDDLSLTYTGNRLTGVSDAADPVILEQSLDFPKSSATMDYDSEGRLCKDTSRGIERITYAPNDMPMGIFGEHGRIKTQYAYSADGRKLSVAYGHNYTSSITDTRYYVGPIEFVKRSGAGSKLAVERVNLPWGYFGDDGSAMVNLTDYQGNIRAVIRGSEVVDRIDYYPYGLPKASSPGSVTRYRYSGKELETRSGLDHYDFHARLQLPSLGLFSRPDPKAADYPGLNPYLYCAANPIIYADPTGEVMKVCIDGINYYFKAVDGDVSLYDEDDNVVTNIASNELSQLLRNLNTLFSSDTAQQTISTVIESEEELLIKFASVEEGNSFNFKTNTLYYAHASSEGPLSINLTTGNTSNNRPSYIGLYHELVHVENKFNGVFDSSVWFYSKSGIPVLRDEISACQKENIIRYELNCDIRISYFNANSDHKIPGALNYFFKKYHKPPSIVNCQLGNENISYLKSLNRAPF